MEKIKKNKNTYTIVQLLVCFFSVIIGVWILSRIHAIILISSDDIGYQNILSGNMTGSPDGHAFFLRYPLAWFISQLYTINDSIPWYKLFLVACVSLCMFLFLTRICSIKECYKKRYFVLSVLIMLLVFSNELIHLEWTAISGLLGATAIYRYITMSNTFTVKSGIKEYGICVFLYTLCFCLRKTVAYMLLPIAGLCVLFKLYKHINNKKKLNESHIEAKKRLRISIGINKQIRANIIFVVVCLFFFAVISVAHSRAYSSSDWSKYREYNRDRSAIFDYYGFPDYDTYQREYELAGISKEAYSLIKTDYNFVVSCDRYNSINIKLIAEVAKNDYAKRSFSEKMSSANELLIDSLTEEKTMMLNVIIIVLIIINYIMCVGKKPIEFVFITSIIGVIAVISTYLAYQGRFPERTVKCADFGLIMVLFGNIVSEWREKSAGINKEKTSTSKKLVWIYLYVVLLLAVVFNQFYLKELNSKREKLATSYAQINEYCMAHSENVYFRDFNSFSQRGELFTLGNDQKADNYIGSGGWMYNSPIYDAIMTRLDFTDFYSAIKHNNLYYLVNEARHKNVMKRLNEYFKASMIPAKVEVADTFETENETVYVLKFVSTK